MRGAKFQVCYFRHGIFFTKHQKSSMYLPCNEQEEKKKVLTAVQLASAVTFILAHGAPRPSASVMKESVSHTAP